MHATLDEFLDRQRSGLASTYLTRLKVGQRLVDARALPTLYAGRVRPRHLLLVLLAGLIALAAAIATTPVGQEWAEPARPARHRPDRRPARTVQVISFRNHVVTLVAVFLALAVGIVLGGGPLSEVGRTTLASSTTPAQEKTADVATFGDTFAVASAGRLYAGGLDGHPVTIVTLPGSDAKVVTGLTAQVKKAGGSVAATLRRRAGAGRPRREVAGRHPRQPADDPARRPGSPSGRPDVRADGPAAGRGDRDHRARGRRPAGEDALAIRQAMAGAELASVPKGDPQKSPLVLVVLGDDVDDDVLAGLLAGLAGRAVGVVAVGEHRRRRLR